MNIVLVLILTFIAFQATGQNCKTYQKVLFHLLPETFPDTVNCIDASGLKQGWWLIYELKENKEAIPDVLQKGIYVESYSYGKYLNNRKIDKWKTVDNVHLITVSRADSFYYARDTTLIISEFANGGWNKTVTYYNADSTKIHYEHFLPGAKHPVVISCNKALKAGRECNIKYRNKKFKEFPFAKFGFEKFRLTFDYLREKEKIDKQLQH